MKKLFNKSTSAFPTHKTTDYSIFKTPVFQRDLDEDRIQRIMDDYNVNGQDPLRGTIDCRQEGTSLRIVKGQHRYEAFKRLGLPIYYRVDQNLSDMDAATTWNDTWTNRDFATAWARAGYPSYKMLLSFVEENNVNMSLAIGLLSGSLTAQKRMEGFRAGEWEATDIDGAFDVIRLRDELLDGYINVKATGDFMEAIAVIRRIPGLDLDRLVKKFRSEFSVRDFKKIQTRREHFRNFERIYNHRAGAMEKLAIEWLADNMLIHNKFKGLAAGRATQSASKKRPEVTGGFDLFKAA